MQSVINRLRSCVASSSIIVLFLIKKNSQENSVTLKQ